VELAELDGDGQTGGDQDRFSTSLPHLVGHPADAPDQLGHCVAMLRFGRLILQSRFEVGDMPQEVQLYPIDVVSFANFLD